MQYIDLINGLQAGLVIDPNTDDQFALYLPRIIEGAELRCYRDLDLMATRKRATTTVAAQTSLLTLPTDWWIGRYLRLWPVSTTKSFYLARMDESFLREYWPDPSAYGTTTPPKYWAQLETASILIAPTTDQLYNVEQSYIFRPTPLSATNTSTYLSSNFGDLFFDACMLEGAAYQKNFGAQSDDPRAAMSWLQSYKDKLETAKREESLRKGEGFFDAGVTPPPASTQPRGG